MVEEHGLVVREEIPKEVVEAGRAAAQELTKIVGSREKKLLLGGKQYLFFEDWQTIGKFYGVTARIERTDEIREDGALTGFVAHAVALHNGEIVSGADAECTRDEQKWSQKPRFQLRSMAQTRACGKALRNCLGWVAVLAGYEATPAEELEGQPEVATATAKRQRSQSMGQPQQGEVTRGGMLTTVEGHLESLYGKKNMTDERKAWMAGITSDYRGVSLLSETELPQAYRKALEEIMSG